MKPLENVTGRAVVAALLDVQAAAGRPLALDDALIELSAVWRCGGCGVLWLAGQACRLCYRCRCAERADVGGRPCPTCGYALD